MAKVTRRSSVYVIFVMTTATPTRNPQTLDGPFSATSTPPIAKLHRRQFFFFARTCLKGNPGKDENRRKFAFFEICMMNELLSQISAILRTAPFRRISYFLKPFSVKKKSERHLSRQLQAELLLIKCCHRIACRLIASRVGPVGLSES